MLLINKNMRPGPLVNSSSAPGQSSSEPAPVTINVVSTEERNIAEEEDFPDHGQSWVSTVCEDPPFVTDISAVMMLCVEKG